ncbi:ABC transporter permease [Herbiconiux sp.]|uniref:ABC transporter permease n=1 Tax=Herbiconiux sp. TaxID=1871186 RepID=UPI0025C35AA8|nr:ABC transporter permease [Herbiconiux sp.]
MGSKPSRLLITVLGTMVGIGALVLTIGLGQTAGGQLTAHFDSVAATHVEAAPTSVKGADGDGHASSALPRDAAARASALAGVDASVLLGEVPLGDSTVTAVPVHDPSSPTLTPPPVWAADGDLLGALDGRLAEGRFFDGGHQQRADRVAVLGKEAADKLGIHSLAGGPSVFIGSHAYSVIGILESVDTRRELQSAAIVPLAAAERDFPDLPPPGILALKIAVGATDLVSHQVPIALDSAEPQNITVAASPTTTALEGGVRNDLDAVFVLIGVITLLAGGLGIANVTLLGVSERTGEIGLRRALGATRPQIAAQFALESLITGALGGTIGAAVGVAVVVAVSAASGWTPVLDLALALGSTLLGGLVGLAAGAYPALKAARTEPADALRS